MNPNDRRSYELILIKFMRQNNPDSGWLLRDNNGAPRPVLITGDFRTLVYPCFAREPPEFLLNEASYYYPKNWARIQCIVLFLEETPTEDYFQFVWEWWLIQGQMIRSVVSWSDPVYQARWIQLQQSITIGRYYEGVSPEEI